MKRWLLILFVILAISALVFIYPQWGEEGGTSLPEESINEEEVPQTEVKNATLRVRSLDGESRLLLTAEKLVQVEDQDRLYLERILLEVFEVEGAEIIATLEAASGIYLPQQGELEFYAPLRVTGQGLEVEADSLSWEQGENRWSGEGNVVIINHLEEIKLTGGKFVAYLDFNRLEVNEDVRLRRLEGKEGEGDDA